MGSFFGGLFSGLGSLASGLMSSSAQNQANQMNQQNFQLSNAESQWWQNVSQQDWSSQFAANQWQQNFNNQLAYGGNISNVMSNLVNAAKANGVSPLAVLGMQAPGASVVPGAGSPSFGGGPSGPDIRPVTGLGSAIGSMGQDVGRAIEGYMDQDARKAALQEEYTRAQITNLDAQSASLTMDAARRLGAPGTAKPNQDVNKYIFGKEPQWPTGIPGDLTQGLLKGIDWGAHQFDKMGQWFEHLRVNAPDPSIYDTP